MRMRSASVLTAPDMTKPSNPSASTSAAISSSSMSTAASTSTAFATSMKKSTTITRVPKFLRCLYDILHNEDQTVLAWSKDGTHFQIFSTRRLEVEVLPKYFKHGKFASFQRQLNNFGFRKWTKTQSNVCTFSHHLFVRRHPQQLVELVVRQNEMSAKSETASSTNALPSNTTSKRKRTESDNACNNTVAGGRKTLKKEAPLSPFLATYLQQRPASLPIDDLDKIEENAFEFAVESWSLMSDIRPLEWAAKPHVVIKTESGNETPTSAAGFGDVAFDFTMEELDDILLTTSSSDVDEGHPIDMHLLSTCYTPTLAHHLDPVGTWETELFEKPELEMYIQDSDLWVGNEVLSLSG